MSDVYSLIDQVKAAKELANTLDVKATPKFLLHALRGNLVIPEESANQTFLTQEQVIDQLPNPNNWKSDPWNFYRLLKNSGLINSENLKRGFAISEYAVEQGMFDYKDNEIIGYSPEVVEVLETQIDHEFEYKQTEQNVRYGLTQDSNPSKKSRISKVVDANGNVYRTLTAITYDLRLRSGSARRLLEELGVLEKTELYETIPTASAITSGQAVRAWEIPGYESLESKPGKNTCMFSPEVYEVIQNIV